MATNKTTVRVSEKFSLALPDYFKGLGIAMGTAFLQMIVDTVNTGNLVFDWKTILVTSISAGAAYLLKNFLIEPAQVITSTPTNAKANKVAEEVKEIV